MTGLGAMGRVDDAHAHLAGSDLQLLFLIRSQNNHFLFHTYLFTTPAGSGGGIHKTKHPECPITAGQIADKPPAPPDRHGSQFSVISYIILYLV